MLGAVIFLSARAPPFLFVPLHRRSLYSIPLLNICNNIYGSLPGDYHSVTSFGQLSVRLMCQRSIRSLVFTLNKLPPCIVHQTSHGPDFLFVGTPYPPLALPANTHPQAFPPELHLARHPPSATQVHFSQPTRQQFAQQWTDRARVDTRADENPRRGRHARCRADQRAQHRECRGRERCRGLAAVADRGADDS